MNKICINNTCFEFNIYHFIFLFILVIVCNYILSYYLSSKTKLKEGLYNINYNIPDDIYPFQYLTRSAPVTKTPDQYDEINKNYDKYDFTKPRITSTIPPEYQQIPNTIKQNPIDTPTPSYIPNAIDSPFLMTSESSPVSPIFESKSHATRAGTYNDYSKKPTKKPTQKPTQKPTKKPTQRPTQKPTQKPTKKPTQKPKKRSTRSSSSESLGR